MKITLSFLPTKEDFINFKFCALKKEVTKKDSVIFLFAGILIILAGILNLVFKEKTLGFLYVAIGAFICLYFKHFYPLIVKNKAASYYDTHGEKFTSFSYILDEDKIEIISDRYYLKAPYNMLYKIEEDKNMILIYSGEGEINYIPKRILSLEEAEFLSKIKDKYIEV